MKTNLWVICRRDKDYDTEQYLHIRRDSGLYIWVNRLREATIFLDNEIDDYIKRKQHWYAMRITNGELNGKA